MDSAANLRSFPTPTHTHDFSNHNNGYIHSNTTFMRSSAGSQKSQSSIGLTLNGFRL
jgi:hypothetical protein